MLRLYTWLTSWMDKKIDPIAKTLPYSQGNILIALQNQINDDTTYDDLPSPEELYERLPSFSKGEWHEFNADLEILQARLFLIVQNDKILLSPRGAYIAKERKRYLND